VSRLRSELSLVFAGEPQRDPVLAAYQDVVHRHGIPRVYSDDLIAGMAMDVGRVRYRTFAELLVYCYRVAGTVGLMMAHVMKVRDGAALGRAAHLGIAMQLTNICRDVAEDEGRGRVYLPQELLGGDFLPSRNAVATARTVRELLRRADGFYRSGDAGLTRLPFRCAVAIRAARLIYAEIGTVLRRRRFDVFRGRAVVSRFKKLWLLVVALAKTCGGALTARRVAE
jgi:phytoene synthase